MFQKGAFNIEHVNLSQSYISMKLCEKWQGVRYILLEIQDQLRSHTRTLRVPTLSTGKRGAKKQNKFTKNIQTFGRDEKCNNLGCQHCLFSL